VGADAVERRPAGPDFVERWFRVTERGSSLGTEVVAGLATFATMSYILFLNPQILGSVKDGDGTQLNPAQVLTVTALVAGVATLAMGIYANYPFALAAGLGLNAFVAFTLVAGLGLTWPQAMGVIVAEGLIVTASVLVGFREAMLNAIPNDLKRAIGVGIGLFITLIGLVNAGVVVHPAGGGTVVAIRSDLSSWQILTFVLGLLLTSALVAWRVKGALLIGLLSTTVIAIVFNATHDDKLWPGGIAVVPDKWVGSPDFNLVGNFSFGFWDELGWATTIAVVLAVLLSDFFDTMGTAIALGARAGLLDSEGRLPGIRRVLLVDSLAAAGGGAASASSNTTYIESAAGVAEGGRTGVTSVVTAVCFLLAIFIAPVAGVIPPEATAPVLVIVGAFMMAAVADIDWEDIAIAIPALLTIVLMPFTYSITNGVGAGFISFVALAALRGRWSAIHPLMVVIAGVFVWYFVHGVV
jgi:AGZA family xanthine/uracil permease-like MFS transporter